MLTARRLLWYLILSLAYCSKTNRPASATMDRNTAVTNTAASAAEPKSSKPIKALAAPAFAFKPVDHKPQLLLTFAKLVDGEWADRTTDQDWKVTLDLDHKRAFVNPTRINGYAKHVDTWPDKPLNADFKYDTFEGVLIFTSAQHEYTLKPEFGDLQVTRKANDGYGPGNSSMPETVTFKRVAKH